jgi:hypothetical protein
MACSVTVDAGRVGAAAEGLHQVPSRFGQDVAAGEDLAHGEGDRGDVDGGERGVQVAGSPAVSDHVVAVAPCERCHCPPECTWRQGVDVVQGNAVFRGEEAIHFLFA